MKIAIAIGVAAVCLIAVILFLRRESAPPSQPARILAPPPPSREPTPKAPENTVAAPPASAPASVEPRRLLADLAKALRDSDEKAVQAILKSLRDLLLPPVPDGQNAAILYLEALQQAREKMDGMSMKGLDRGVYSAAITGRDLTPEQMAALRDWYEKNGKAAAEVTGLLREAGQRPLCRFPDQSSAEAQRTVTGLQYASNLLRITAMLQQREGKAGDAAETARAGLAMARASRSAPDIVSQMIGCALDSVTLDGVQQSMDPSTPGLAAWLDGVDPASVRESYLRSLLGDVASTVAGVLKSKADPRSVSDEALRRKIESPLVLQDLAAYVEGINDFARLAGRPYHETRGEMDALVRQHGEFAPWYASFSQDIVPSMPGLSRVIAKSEAQTSMAKLSLALERYRAVNRGYPATLDALNSAPPRDPFTGQPFGYRKEGSGFILESPGAPDGKDALKWRSRP
jgi:hypothetical protein